MYLVKMSLKETLLYSAEHWGRKISLIQTSKGFIVKGPLINLKFTLQEENDAKEIFQILALEGANI